MVQHIAAFLCCATWTALKDMYEDMRRRRDDDAENLRVCHRFDRTTKAFVDARWCDVLYGDILLTLENEAIPADALLVHACQGQAFISTVNLDGETNLKERRAVELLSAVTELSGSMTTRRGGLDQVMSSAKQSAELLLEQGLELVLEEPKSFLTDMGGSVTFKHPTDLVKSTLEHLKVSQPCILNFEHFVPRGCVLRNTNYIVSVAAYVGSETKTRLNVSATNAKISNMQHYVNRGVMGLVTFLVLFCIYAGVRKQVSRGGSIFGGLLEKRAPKADMSLIVCVLSYWIILYSLIPVSLYVAFELVKLLLGFQINRDPQMVDPKTQKPALARTADLVEEMGQVNFVFSDKTGTLTENEMVFARACVAEQDLGDFRQGDIMSQEFPPGVAEVRRIIKSDQSRRAEVRWFFFCLVVCHTGQVDIDDKGEPHFSGSSPDEVAFLQAARAVGITFKARRRLPGSSGWELHIVGPPGEGNHIFTVICEIPFSSDRKRMTVVCEYKGEFFCITKGADNVMGALCDEAFSEPVLNRLMEYSKLGLRTLTIASKVVERPFLEEWQKRFLDAQVRNPTGGEETAQVAAEMEHSLMLSGITAIEDKLQEGVPEAIVTIKAAGIRFWVLTGDKTETAVEIVRACRLFTEDMTLSYLVDCTSPEHAVQILEAAQEKLKGASEAGLIMDGTFVKFVLQQDQCKVLLYNLAMESKACVCCRLSPQQKQKLVQLVKELNLYGITLAIGDGANDVPMIQGAHVGIGVRGKEGNQAVQASDVAISQFRFLVPLLICHGRRAYRRVAVFLCYYLYKHIALVVGDMLWAHQNKFYGDLGYSEWLTTAFPLLTTLPVIIVLGYDQDVPNWFANEHPELYSEGLQRTRFNVKVFLIWILSAVWHGSVAWLVPSYILGNDNPKTPDFWRASCISFTLVMIFVNARLWIISMNPLAPPNVAVITLCVVFHVIWLFILGETSFGTMIMTNQPLVGVPSTIFSERKYLMVLGGTAMVLVLDLVLYCGSKIVRPTPLDLARRQKFSGGPEGTSTAPTALM